MTKKRIGIIVAVIAVISIVFFLLGGNQKMNEKNFISVSGEEIEKNIFPKNIDMALGEEKKWYRMVS